MFELFKNTLSILKRNWPTLLYFEIIHRIISSFLIYSCYQEIMALILKNTGMTLITQENIRLMLYQPLSAVLFIGFFLLVAALIFFEITALLLYCQSGWNHISINLFQLYYQTIKTFIHFFHLKNLLMMLLLSLLIELSSFPFTYAAFRIAVPEFIKDTMLAEPVLTALYWLLLLLINLLLFSYIFGFIFIQHSFSFSAAWRKSLNLIKQKPLRLFLRLLVFMILLQLGLLLVFLVITCLIAFNTYLSFGADADVIRFSLSKFSDFYTFLNGIITAAALTAFIVIENHRLINEPRRSSVNTKMSIHNRIIHMTSGLFAILLMLIISESEIGDAVYAQNNKDTQIIAHRAGSVFAPENTLSALNTAINDGADSAEIDVQQTQDGVLIVMHDTNFKRTAGLNSQVWNTSYDIVKTLDAGSSFDTKFAGEPIPTLEMMLAAAKDRIDLMIELKANGHEQNLEESTLALINKYDMKKQCVIASMDSKILRQVKLIDPEIETVLITAVFYANLLDYDFIDGYSIETSFVTYEIATLAEFSNKKLYAWTANEEDNINKVLRIGVDGIVTDNPLLAQYCQDTLDENLFVNALVNFFFPSEASQ